MAVRPCLKHENCWIVDWRPSGRNGPRERRHITGPESEATAYWLEMVTLSRRQRHMPAGHDPKALGVIVDWQEEYNNDHLPTTIRDLKHCMVHLVKFFGGYHLSEICPALIEKYKAERLSTKINPKQRQGEKAAAYAARVEANTRTISRRTITKELAYFSGFLKWCHERGYMEQPMRIKRFPAKQTQSQRPIIPIDPATTSRLVKALAPEYRGPFLCMVDAGMRRSEALGLTAEAVHLTARVVVVVGKGGKERIFPIATDRLYKALHDAVKERLAGHLWVNGKTGQPWYSIRKALQRAAKKEGIEQAVYHHLLRHSFITVAIASGANPRSVQHMAGHSSFSTTERYIHLAGAFHAEEARKIGRYLEGDATTVDSGPTAKPRRTGVKKSDH